MFIIEKQIGQQKIKKNDSPSHYSEITTFC